MSETQLFGLGTALALALIHLQASKLRFLDVIPRSRWLSFAGGVSVAYALLHLIPELNAYEAAFSEWQLPLEAMRILYLLVLIGMTGFYGLERMARRHSPRDQKESSPAGVFWIHIASFAIYNALVGYTLVQEERSFHAILLYFLAIGLHFVVNDYGLREHHRDAYRRIGRWVLSASILLGWLVGISLELPDVAAGTAVAVLAGGILLNTFKEEIPPERESRFGAFALGAALYACVLLAL